MKEVSSRFAQAREVRHSVLTLFVIISTTNIMLQCLESYCSFLQQISCCNVYNPIGVAMSIILLAPLQLYYMIVPSNNKLFSPSSHGRS